MSRRSQEVKLAEKIMSLRWLQHQSAEMRLLHAQSELQKIEMRQSEINLKSKGDQDSWAHTLGGAAMDVSIARAWQGEVLRTEATLDEANNALGEAKGLKSQADGLWRISRLRFEKAEDMTERAKKRARLAIDEAALSELADRRAAPWPFR